MKEIKAYVRNSMVNNVIDALAQLPSPPSVAVVPLEAFGHGVDNCEFAKVQVTKLEVDVPEDLLDAVLVTIKNHARTGDGHAGDGRILVSDVGRAIRISDGEEGPDVLG
jgi:nitrogen regulatory protein P-II 1